MKIVIIIVVFLLLATLFLFRVSRYTCTSENPEFKDGKRCYDSDGKINIAGPFCKEECKGSWK